jgi:hypothetical protein
VAHILAQTLPGIPAAPQLPATAGISLGPVLIPSAL